MERLANLYNSLHDIRFDDLAGLNTEEASELILRIEDLENQLRKLTLNNKHGESKNG